MSARDTADRLGKRRAYVEISTSEGPIYVRGLNGRERALYFEWLSGPDPLFTDQRLLALTLGDGNGGALFAEDQKSQLEGLAVVKEWLHEDVESAAKKVLSMSGMAKDSAEEAGKKS